MQAPADRIDPHVAIFAGCRYFARETEAGFLVSQPAHAGGVFWDVIHDMVPADPDTIWSCVCWPVNIAFGVGT